MKIGDTIAGCTILGIAPSGDADSYIILVKQNYQEHWQYITGRVYVRQLPNPTEWWNGDYSSTVEGAVQSWIDRSCISGEPGGRKWLADLIRNTEKALADAAAHIKEN